MLNFYFFNSSFLVYCLVKCILYFEILTITNKNIPTYNGSTAFGLQKTKKTWHLQVWSLMAEDVIINFYDHYNQQNPSKSYSLIKKENDTWIFESDSIAGLFYDFQILRGQKLSKKIIDPYAKVVSVNGLKGYVALPSTVNPDGWENDQFVKLNSPNDALLYEMSVRDFTMDTSSGVINKGKFMGLSEPNTSFGSILTGLDHLVELGITHVHLLPVFDFRSIDETQIPKPYNWGYEPLNFNALEGSFANDPYDPLNRISEFKSMILSLHEKNIGVIMDVVYNHTTSLDQHSFQVFSPDYYYRKNEHGRFSNASACGNEIASEKEYVRNYIVESLKFWMNEYHIDGFRFDLMGVLDIETMNLIESELRKINPGVLLYGEGWAAGQSPLKKNKSALKENSSKLGQIAIFSDEFRDGVKGHYSDGKDKGFVSGNQNYRESVKFGITAGLKHPQVNIKDVVYTDTFWADEAGKMIGYVSCHDNYTLFDKLQLSNPNTEIDHLIKLQCLSNGIVLTSQAIPFIHSGAEFLRTKSFDEDSFESPDSINSIKWENKEKYLEVFNFHKSLIQLRKNHPAFRINQKEELIEKLKFDSVQNPLLISYKIGPYANKDSWKWIMVIINGSDEDLDVTLGKGEWKYTIENLKVDQEGFKDVSERITVSSKSLQILYSN